MEMVTLQEISERDKVSRQAISKNVRDLVRKHDIPVERDGRNRIVKVSIASYDHYRSRFVNPAKASAPLRHEGNTSLPLPVQQMQLPMDGAASSVGETLPDVSANSFEEARRRNEWIKNERAELALAEERGAVVRTDRVLEAVEKAGREIQAVVSRLQNRADDLAMVVSRDGVHGLRSELRKVSFDINGDLAKALLAIAEAAPKSDEIDLRPLSEKDSQPSLN